MNADATSCPMAMARTMRPPVASGPIGESRHRHDFLRRTKHCVMGWMSRAWHSKRTVCKACAIPTWLGTAPLPPETWTCSPSNGSTQAPSQGDLPGRGPRKPRNLGDARGAGRCKGRGSHPPRRRRGSLGGSDAFHGAKAGQGRAIVVSEQCTQRRQFLLAVHESTSKADEALLLRWRELARLANPALAIREDGPLEPFALRFPRVGVTVHGLRRREPENCGGEGAAAGLFGEIRFGGRGATAGAHRGHVRAPHRGEAVRQGQAQLLRR
eukprot:CAMPEP_0117509068 /NCGR_PEP_ID=MMETSP0784-20121206/27279_1 /TAXON_ID=39447 /ORGANISM="" /LENGTH=268 /DNA_ID=CAMNT_0005304653 /DNA_START=177 /DNA_END=985 /DNA_ORIENTATION=-